ncbi:MAG: hypothetical protein IPI43_12960 [Sandaracinaceae bacterium]|nr:hypothetical protein [Sandaracinaceae bacterium]MBK7775020.1 hypothetical protein [Sandaracinaceae bacterium]
MKTGMHTIFRSGLGRGARSTFPALLLVLGLGGCVEIIGIEDTEIEPGRDLTCVGNVTPPVSDGEPVLIRAVITNITDPMRQGPVPGVQVVRCNSRLGAACDFGTPYFPDPETFIVEVPVTSGFNGYLRILDADTDDADDWVPYLWYFSQPIINTRAEPFPIQALTVPVREGLIYPETSVTQDPARGDMAINAVDCGDTNAPNIHFEVTTPASISAGTDPWYFSGMMVVIASAPANETTDGLGLGGFRGLEPGTIGIRSYVADTFDFETRNGELVAEDTLLIEPDTLTTVRLLPE